MISISTSRTSACPGPPPETLRTLFQNSELVVIATTGNSQVIGKSSENFYKVNTELQILSVHKGELVGSNLAYDQVIYGESETDVHKMEAGKMAIFFLNRDKDTGEFENQAIKEISAESVAAYMARMDELGQILSSNNGQAPKMLEWLIRCADDPVTRKETYLEFLMGMGRETETNAIPSKEVAQIQQFPGVLQEVKQINESEYSCTIYSFTAMLSAAQKEHLINTLLKSNKITNDDDLLLTLAKSWNDRRVIPLIIDQLRNADNDEMNGIMLDTLISLLDNKVLTSMFDEYNSISEVIYNDMSKESAWKFAYEEQNEENLSEAEQEAKEEQAGRYQTEFEHRVAVKSKERLTQILDQFDKIYLNDSTVVF